MTMYQPNDDVRPTGAEVDEFVDTPMPRDDDDGPLDGGDTEPTDDERPDA
jgi:hypothetical protein